MTTRVQLLKWLERWQSSESEESRYFTIAIVYKLYFTITAATCKQKSGQTEQRSTVRLANVKVNRQTGKSALL